MLKQDYEYTSRRRRKVAMYQIISNQKEKNILILLLQIYNTLRRNTVPTLSKLIIQLATFFTIS